ncbi:MAG: radical SAM protein [Candidatus Omnitrophica bacterium]|nr:radical SAM protein [Candidatus Omnitrophota bacterium]
MRILLLSPPYLPEYMRNGRCDYVSWSSAQWYPIWLAYCGALLEKNGHKVRLIDALAERLTFKQARKRIVDFSPDILVVYSSTKSQQNDIYFAEGIKDEISCYVVFVGPYVSAGPEAVLETSCRIDAVVKGEFEYPILQLAHGHNKSKISNLVWRDNKEIIVNDRRGPLTREELENIPFVSCFYHRNLNIANYKVPSELHPFVDIFTGRGCFWGKCTFCLWPQSFIEGPAYNTRSIENLIEELKFITSDMPYIKEVFFQDDTLPSQRAVAISNSILENDLKIAWGCYLRADVGYSILRLMRQAGCRTIHVGYECRSQSILKNIGKGLTPEEMTEFTYNAHKAGLRVHADFILGLPGDTEDTIRQTIKWAKLLDPETAQFLSVNLYPNTALSNSLQKQGCIKNGKPDYPDLSAQALAKWRKQAYREFYIRWKFIKKIILHPEEYLFSRGRAVWLMLSRTF